VPESAGNWLIVGGIVLIAAGLAWRYGLLGWFGHLPGDISIRGENSAFFFPLTSMILVSAVFSLLLDLFRRF